LNNLAAQLSPGWVRYPSGSFSDAFNWQTGLMNPDWANQFQGDCAAKCIRTGGCGTILNRKRTSKPILR
jgi:hypothetical protein